jgi:hypothetical protein
MERTMAGDGERPFVAVMAANGAAPALRDAVLYGLEEEGVPALLAPTDGDEADLLARQGASISPLGLGIGLDASGACAVWHVAVTSGPYLRLAGPVDAEQARLAGSAAGRLAKRRPLPDPIYPAP